MPLRRFMPAVLAIISLVSTVGAVEAGNPFAPPEGLPGGLKQMAEACADIPSLADFSRNGLFLEHGYQQILLGNRIPIAPAPHISWAKPYHRKPRVLIFQTLDFSDTPQVAQLVRELDCDPRFVLIADIPMIFDYFRDERYRLGYLADQARTALKEDYDGSAAERGRGQTGARWLHLRLSHPGGRHGAACGDGPGVQRAGATARASCTSPTPARPMTLAAESTGAN